MLAGARRGAITLLALTLASCGESRSERDEEPTRDETEVETPREEPTPEPAPPRPRLGTTRERCTLEGDRLLAPTVPPGRTASGAVAIAADGDASSTLVAIDASEARDEVELWWPHGESSSSGTFLRDLEEGSLFALEMTRPDAALLVRTSACVHEGHAAQCLYARTIRFDEQRTEARVSPPVVVAMPSAPSTLRVNATDGRVLVARSHVGAAPALDGFYVEDTARPPRHLGRVLGEGLDLDRGPVEILALASTDGLHAVLFRQGAQEASDSTVTLSTGLDEHAVPELREALVIESVAIFTGSLSMIAAFEFSEPSWLRMGMDGEMIGEPRPLAAGEDVPIPFSDRRVARLDGSPPRTIEIRDGAGHGTAPLVPLAADVRMADLARFDGGFLVATLGEDTNVHVSTLRCRDAASADPSPPTPALRFGAASDGDSADGAQ